MKSKPEEKNKKATNHPTQHHWHEMNRKQRRETMRKIQSEELSLKVIHPHAAGIDIGNESHYGSQCLLVGISPALISGTLFSLLMAIIVVMVASGGHRVYPRDFIGHMLVSCLVIPVGAALLGTLPLLGALSYPQEIRSQIAR